MNLKGQASLELLVTLGVILAFTIPVIFLIFSISSVGYEDTAKAQADAAARTLADSMNSIYSQGAGAEREVLLNAPPSTKEIYASGGEVIVKITTSEGDFEAVSPTIAKISPGSTVVKNKGGLFRLIVQTNANGEVELIDPNQ